MAVEAIPVAPLVRRYRVALLVHDGAWGPLQTAAAAAGLPVRRVDGGASQVPRYEVLPAETQSADAAAKAAELTSREFETLRGMARGQTNKAIAEELYLSEDTVKTHARRLFRKLGARDRGHAVAIGYQRGILGGP